MAKEMLYKSTAPLGVEESVTVPGMKFFYGDKTTDATIFAQVEAAGGALPGSIYFGSGAAAGKMWIKATANGNAGDWVHATVAAPIDTADLVNKAVTAAKMADATITVAQLANDAVEAAKIKNANVTLAKLAAGITPSHVVKYAGKITWSGSGASLATTIAGVAATDIVVCTIQTAPTQAAYLVSAAPTTDTLTVTLSAANTSNNAVIAYQVLRAAA